VVYHKKLAIPVVNFSDQCTYMYRRPIKNLDKKLESTDFGGGGGLDQSERLSEYTPLPFPRSLTPK